MEQPHYVVRGPSRWAGALQRRPTSPRGRLLLVGIVCGALAFLILGYAVVVGVGSPWATAAGWLAAAVGMACMIVDLALLIRHLRAGR